MAAYSLISAVFYSSPTLSPFYHSPNRNPTFSPFKYLPRHEHRIRTLPIIFSLHHRQHQNSCASHSNTLSSSCFQKLPAVKTPLTSALVSLLLLCTSIAISFSLFIAEVDSASAFVVTPPRKLQSDELATVRLFQENTPSVVYITNLAVRCNCIELWVIV